jgi:hypothetical protein
MLRKGISLAAGVVVAGASTLAVAAPAHAADSRAVVTAVEGSALVSRGDDTVPLTAGMDLYPLNRIFVLETSEATITFADGCERTIGENAMLTLDDSGTCPKSSEVEQAATSLAEGQGTSTRGSFAAAAALPPGSPAFLPVPAGDATLGLAVLGGLAVGGVIWAATDGDDNDSRTVASQAPPPLSP